MEDNLFLESCLVQLSTSCWQGSRMLDPSVMAQVGDSNWLKGRKHLVDPETLSPIRAVVARTRKEIEGAALPFPIKGLYLVPKRQLSEIDAILIRYQKEYWKEVERFEEGYATALELARTTLGDLFDESDYPINIHAKFGFEWRYLALQTPQKFGILSPEIYEREKAKFSAMMEETRNMAIEALRAEFTGHVNHIIERLTNNEDGTPKIFNSTMVTKIQEYLTSFDARNMFHDKALAELVETAKNLVGGVSVSRLRDDLSLRKHIRTAMEGVKETMDSQLIDLPRRKIRMVA